MDAETSSVASTSSSDSWLDELRKRYEGKKDCGFGVYYHPMVVNESTLGMTRARHDSLLENIKHKIGFHGPSFTLQPLEWPADLEYDTEALAKDNAQFAPLPPSAYEDSSDEDDDDDEDDPDSEEARAAAGYDGPADLLTVNFDHGNSPSWHESIFQQCRQLHGPEKNPIPESYSTAVLLDRDATQELKTIFDKLRTEFKLFRNRPRVAFVKKRNRFRSDSSLGLFDGILDKVFIVADPYSAFSWWDLGSSNLSWMWIVDPDYESDQIVNTNGLTEQYQGYLRVHLQSLCDDFLQNLLFHEDISLQQMWEVARRHDLRAFTSMPT